MFLSSLIEELCTKEENNKAGCTVTFGGQCTKALLIYSSSFFIRFCNINSRKYTLIRKLSIEHKIHLRKDFLEIHRKNANEVKFWDLIREAYPALWTSWTTSMIFYTTCKKKLIEISLVEIISVISDVTSFLSFPF